MLPIHGLPRPVLLFAAEHYNEPSDRTSARARAESGLRTSAAITELLQPGEADDGRIQRAIELLALAEGYLELAQRIDQAQTLLTD